MYWSQRSRVKRISWGEENTSFFHSSTVQRRQRNKLIRLQNSEGDWKEGDDALAGPVKNHFAKLFDSEQGRQMNGVLDVVQQKVTEQMNWCLIGDISREEVKKAAFELGAKKAPGPDGFSGIFYQKY